MILEPVELLLRSGMCQMMDQMAIIVTHHLHHVGTYKQFWTEQEMVLTSMLHLILCHWIFRIHTICTVKKHVTFPVPYLTPSVTLTTNISPSPVY